MDYKKIAITFLLCLCSFTCFAFENLFYILRSNDPARIPAMQNAFSRLSTHYKSIDLLVSQAYQIDANGVVWGFIDPQVKKFVKEHNIKLMVLVTNRKFDTELAHKFLSDSKAQETAINTIVSTCKKHSYYGVQFDFEMIRLEDRDELTHFYRKATEALHKEGFKVSYAIAPVVTDSPQASDFLKRLYENWEGAYDLKALGEMGDFVTVMAYNQHGQGTTPGTTAGLRWVEATTKYALRHIPATKISLGIPSYSNYWYTGTDPNSKSGKIKVLASEVNFEKVNYLLKKYHPRVHWDERDKLHYALYEHNWLNEYIFIEDAKSFKYKYEVAKKYNLRGISVFDLGSEDPAIWSALPKA